MGFWGLNEKLGTGAPGNSYYGVSDLRKNTQSVGTTVCRSDCNTTDRQGQAEPREESNARETSRERPKFILDISYWKKSFPTSSRGRTRCPRNSSADTLAVGGSACLDKNTEAENKASFHHESSDWVLTHFSNKKH